jgi:hypothetical protein
MSSTFYSTVHQSEHAYVNGVPVKDIDLTETRDNKSIEIKGHINHKRVHIRRQTPYVWNNGMTTRISKRNKRKRMFSQKSAKVKKSDKDISHMKSTSIKRKTPKRK